MRDIVDFLLARIAEDERVAREASDDGHKWLLEEETISLWPDDREPADGFIGFPRKAHAHHAVTWNPARVLAECEAKRRAVEMCEPLAQWEVRRQTRNLARGTLRELARPYRDHPDYDPAWEA